jgi:hypothetical protein
MVGGKMRNLLTKGIPSKKTGVSQPDIAHLWKSRGTSLFLKSSLLVFLIGGTMSWALEDRWGAGVSWEQRMRNLDRFTGEIVPYPVREADGDWREFGSWFGEKMLEGGKPSRMANLPSWNRFYLTCRCP